MKVKILKVLYYLSFLGYAFVIYVILSGQYYLNGVELQGIQRLLTNLKTYIYYYLFSIPIIPMCFTYQMCYKFRNNRKKLLFCSFVPCLFILLLGLYHAIFGVKFFDETSYGLPGFMIGVVGGLYSYTIILLLPMCLIFQIYLFIKGFKKK